MRVFLSCAPAVTSPKAATAATSAAITRFMGLSPQGLVGAFAERIPEVESPTFTRKRRPPHGTGDRRPEGNLSRREARRHRPGGRAEAREAGLQGDRASGRGRGGELRRR